MILTKIEIIFCLFSKNMRSFLNVLKKNNASKKLIETNSFCTTSIHIFTIIWNTFFSENFFI